ncbi:MAG: DUF5320 domain-containing protein [Eubacteriales bacterium]|nr:DUF5320 domain-containing protein [Eubacteriales bacterium]
MPGRDGTGPLGFGAMTGRGLGLGLGYGCRRGRFFNIAPSAATEKEILSAERDFLEARLDVINKHLDTKKESDE